MHGIGCWYIIATVAVKSVTDGKKYNYFIGKEAI